MDIKLFQMGFGESILLSENQKHLLVDCGSIAPDAAPNFLRTSYFQEAARSLNTLRSTPRAMISHFHNDHINGFLYLIDNSDIRFDTVYIPNIFIRGRHPNQVDFAIVKSILEQLTFPYVSSLSLWDFLQRMIDNRRPIKQIKLLQREKRAFQFSNYSVDVLWPCPEKLIDKSLWAEIEDTIPTLLEYRQAIYELSDDISSIYLAISDRRGGAFGQFDNQNENILQRTLVIRQGLTDLTGRIIALLEQRSSEVDSKIKKISQKLDHKPNETSIVCQIHDNRKHDEKKLLLTGDITRVIMRRIAKNAYKPSIPLLDEYYAIKAPHHGTCTHYFDFCAFTKCRFMLISNGSCTNTNYHGVSAKYCPPGRSYYLICTNDRADRCKHLTVAPPCALKKDQCCCNPACNAPFLKL